MADEEQRENLDMLSGPLPYQTIHEHEFHGGNDTKEAMQAAGRARRRNLNEPNIGVVPPDRAYPWRIKSRGDNLGLSCAKDLPQNVPVLACRGEVYYDHDPPPRLDYALAIPAGFIIFYLLRASLFWFVNSSCRPNTKLVYIWENDICYPCLVPLRRIFAGEEITWDFNYSRDRNTPLKRCVCGAGRLCRVVLAYLRPNEARYQCPICRRCFDSAALRYQHIVVVEIFGGRIPCPFTGCICSYIHMTNLYRHIFKHHDKKNDPRDYSGSFHRTCLKCRGTFTGPSAFMAHVEKCIGMEVTPLPAAPEEDEQPQNQQQQQQQQQPLGLLDQAMIQSGILDDLGNYVFYEEDLVLNTEAPCVNNPGPPSAEYQNYAPPSSTLPQPGTSTGGYTTCGPAAVQPCTPITPYPYYAPVQDPQAGYPYIASQPSPQQGPSTGGYPYIAPAQSPLPGYPYIAPQPSPRSPVQDPQVAHSPRRPYNVDTFSISSTSSKPKGKKKTKQQQSSVQDAKKRVFDLNTMEWRSVGSDDVDIDDLRRKFQTNSDTMSIGGQDFDWIFSRDNSAVGSCSSKGKSEQKKSFVQDLFNRNLDGIAEKILQQQREINQPRRPCGGVVTKEAILSILQDKVPRLVRQILRDPSTSPQSQSSVSSSKKLEEEIAHRRAIQQQVEGPISGGYEDRFLKSKAQSQASRPKPLSKAPPKSPTCAIKRQIATQVKNYFEGEVPDLASSSIPNREAILTELNSNINQVMQITMTALMNEQCLHCIRALNREREMESRIEDLEQQVGNMADRQKRRRSSSSNAEEGDEEGNKRDSSGKPLKKKPTREEDQS